MATVEGIYKQSPAETDFFKGYGQNLSGLISRLDLNAVLAVAERFEEASSKGQTIFFAGNGGSAATASHFVQDLGEIVRKAGGKPFRALSLNDHAAALTAISNDYDYSQVFSLQMANHFQAGDVLVVISASGNSPNVVKAAELAKERKGTAIGLVGFDGGRLAEICDIVVCVKTEKGEYGPVEDVHMVLDHMITSYLVLKKRHRP
ncbi:MAG: SIS domain-containing protein [Candidatus Omnitrophica bacterium]|nr:SIS domain-containing protein [Candidatus Omnitrophota bacterium]